MWAIGTNKIFAIFEYIKHPFLLFVFYQLDPQSERKQLVPSENFDGKLLKRAS